MSMTLLSIVTTLLHCIIALLLAPLAPVHAACDSPAYIKDKYGVDLETVHGSNIYTEFKNGPNGPAQREIKLDVQHWGLDESTLSDILNKVRPELIIEVGSWMGGSAIAMAKMMRAQGHCFTIMCVDTWLGTPMAWIARDQFGNYLSANAGYPSVFYQYLVNVKESGFSDVIIPVPNPSVQATIYLKKVLRKKPQVIFIDACHDYECVRDDLAVYWPLVMHGSGIMFGDDYAKEGVKRAVEEFCKTYNTSYELIGRYWVMRKAFTEGSLYKTSLDCTGEDIIDNAIYLIEGGTRRRYETMQAFQKSDKSQHDASSANHVECKDLAEIPVGKPIL